MTALIEALTPLQPGGHQFVCYGDCCSGIAAAPHEATFASVNKVVSRLQPAPEFICFLGDEIKGLTADEALLRQQWRYWFDREMAWLDRDRIPLYHTTGNHTTYNAASEAVFRDIMAHLPRNGPPGQEGLSYFVRKDDLLLVFINTAWSGIGGEGRVEIAWLDEVLTQHRQVRYKLVLGHHPVHPINGFSGPYQRHLAEEQGRRFWQSLVQHQVLAYICSHIMAFDVQVHQGVLQISTAGAGTLPLMPEGIEYLHCVQMALDRDGLRYQVLDTAGTIREWLNWPVAIPASRRWQPLLKGAQPAPIGEEMGQPATQARLIVWKFEGICAPPGPGEAQTLISGWTPGPALAPWWLGFRGPENRLCFLLSVEPGRSPHYWLGPAFSPDQPFSVQVAIHPGMGPGGFLWRESDSAPWSSMLGATAWGADKFSPQSCWSVGHDQYGEHGQPFRGQALEVSFHNSLLLCRSVTSSTR
jgi:hypothetical protein